MPEKKTESVGKALGWTIQGQLNEIRGKLHMGECDRKVQYAWMENERLVNESTIIHSRHDTKQRRIMLAESINADEHVIKNVFANRREEQLSLKRLTAAKAVAEMDQKVCERVKMLNDLRYNRRSREKKLRDMSLELKEMKAAKPAEQLESAQRVRGLENSLDKAKMKFETAKNIRDQYDQIVKKMREESMTFPGSLDTLEGAVVDTHKELSSLTKMEKEAQRTKDVARADLSKLERELHATRKERDTILANTKKEVESRQVDLAKPEKREKKSKPQLNDGQLEKRALMQSKIKSENQLILLKYDSLFNEIKHATGLTHLADFVGRFENQNDTRDRLLTRTAEYQQLSTKLRLEKEDLARTLKELKYSGEKRFSVGQDTLEQVEDDNNKKKDDLADVKESLNEKGTVLVAVKKGMKTIFQKLIDISLPPPTHNRLTGNAEIDIELITKKFDMLLASVDEKDIERILNLPNLHEILGKELGDDNIRVQLKESSSSIGSEYEFELQNLDEVPSRDDIKLKAQHLIESKMPKQKKKKGMANAE